MDRGETPGWVTLRIPYDLAADVVAAGEAHRALLPRTIDPANIAEVSLTVAANTVAIVASWEAIGALVKRIVRRGEQTRSDVHIRIGDEIDLKIESRGDDATAEILAVLSQHLRTPPS